MKVLIVSATSFELPFVGSYDNLELDFLTTGVGLTATAFALGEKLGQSKYDLAINVGLAGAFGKELSLGEVVEVEKDIVSEEGAEDGYTFLSLDQIGLRRGNEAIFSNGWLKATYSTNNPDIKKVRGISVNTVHGNEKSIQKVVERLTPQVESMEGAAFLYSCLKKELACVQLRAISNYVEKRNKAAWKIELALDNLALELKAFLSQLDANT